MSDSRARLTANYTVGSVGYHDWWAPILNQLAASALDALTIPPGAPRLLDLACGTGLAGRRLSTRLPMEARLVAGDLVPAMLALARKQAPDIPLVCFDAARLPFPDRVFDRVVCTFALHHIREQRRALGEAYRVLKPGGQLLVLTWGSEGQDACPAETAWDDLLLEMFGDVTVPEPAPAWHDEINTPAAFASMLTSLGFQCESVTASTGAYDYTPETLAGVRLGFGVARRRFLALTPAGQVRFEERARRLLATLPASDFACRPGIVIALAGKPLDDPLTEENGAAAATGDFRTTCPNCGAVMHDRGCKTRCPRCHFFTDCSDPW